MSVIIILIVVSVCIAGAFLIAFIWSTNDGQYDDIYSPSQRVLFDDYLESENKTEE